MLSVVCILFCITCRQCTAVSQQMEQMSALVGDNVTLTCNRSGLVHSSNNFWLRIVPGTMPDVLGAIFTFNSDYTPANESPRILAKQEPGTLVLQIMNTKMTDTGMYYCANTHRLKMIFLKGIQLNIKGPKPVIRSMVKDPIPGPVHPGDSVQLQCSVLWDSQTDTCPGGHDVYWFTAAPDQYHPGALYTYGNRSSGCGESLGAPSPPQSCVYSLNKTLRYSDSGMYYCAVAMCGEIFFGNGLQLDIDVEQTENSTELFCNPAKAEYTILSFVCGTLTITVIVLAFLIYTSKKRKCNCCNCTAPVNQTQINGASSSVDHRGEARNEELVYSTATFTSRKNIRIKREAECIYSDVRNFGWE